VSGRGATGGSAIRMVIVGASGRMGTQLLRLLDQFPALRLVGAVASERSTALGKDAGLHAGAAASALPISPALPPLLQQADLVLDFSSPAAADVIPLLVAPNTSLGVTLMLELVRQAAQALPRNYDIEIMEAHHRNKADAPSGTALALGEAASAGRGQSLAEQAVYTRHGQPGPRHEGQIGYAVVRGGDVVGEHQVWFLGDGERLLLQHSATDRSVFARGALLAAQWLAGKPAGRYGMRDVFISGYR